MKTEEEVKFEVGYILGELEKSLKEYYKPDYKILDSEKVWKNPRRS